MENPELKIKVTVSDCYDDARKALEEGDVKVADARGDGFEVDDELDGVRIGLWLERFWYFLENNNLMLDGK